jgi:hypothetical protein
MTHPLMQCALTAQHRCNGWQRSVMRCRPLMLRHSTDWNDFRRTLPVLRPE